MGTTCCRLRRPRCHRRDRRPRTERGRFGSDDRSASGADVRAARQPDLASSEANVRVAGANRLAVIGEYIPSLGVATSAGRGTTVQGASGVTNGIPIPSSLRPLDDIYGSGISTSFRFSRAAGAARNDEARPRRRSPRARALAATEFDVRLATKQAYFDVLRAGELVDVANARVAQACRRQTRCRAPSQSRNRDTIGRSCARKSRWRELRMLSQQRRRSFRFRIRARPLGRKRGPLRAAPIADDHRTGDGNESRLARRVDRGLGASGSRGAGRRRGPPMPRSPRHARNICRRCSRAADTAGWSSAR